MLHYIKYIDRQRECHCVTGTVEEQKHVHKKNQELNVGIHYFFFLSFSFFFCN